MYSVCLIRHIWNYAPRPGFDLRLPFICQCHWASCTWVSHGGILYLFVRYFQERAKSRVRWYYIRGELKHPSLLANFQPRYTHDWLYFLLDIHRRLVKAIFYKQICTSKFLPFSFTHSYQCSGFEPWHVHDKPNQSACGWSGDFFPQGDFL